MSRATSGLVVTLTLGASTAGAQPDFRPPDRFFFGLGVGASVDRNLEGDYDPAVGYETSYWPNDYVGMGTIVTLSTARTTDLRAEFVLAVPLRYIQPYGGAQIGWRSVLYRGVEGRIDLVAGVNVYASRSLRVFAELRDLPQVDVPMIGAHHEELALTGLRWSPDAFHRARGVSKFDYVWLSMLFSVTVWGAATLAQ